MTTNILKTNLINKTDNSKQSNYCTIENKLKMNKLEVQKNIDSNTVLVLHLADIGHLQVIVRDCLVPVCRAGRRRRRSCTMSIPVGSQQNA